MTSPSSLPVALASAITGIDTAGGADVRNMWITALHGTPPTTADLAVASGGATYLPGIPMTRTYSGVAAVGDQVSVLHALPGGSSREGGATTGGAWLVIDAIGGSPPVTRGVVSVTFNGSDSFAGATVTHGLGSTPSVVHANTGLIGIVVPCVAIDTLTSTTFALLIAPANLVAPSAHSQNVMWTAYR